MTSGDALRDELQNSAFGQTPVVFESLIMCPSFRASVSFQCIVLLSIGCLQVATKFRFGFDFARPNYGPNPNAAPTYGRNGSSYGATSGQNEWVWGPIAGNSSAVVRHKPSSNSSVVKPRERVTPYAAINVNPRVVSNRTHFMFQPFYGSYQKVLPDVVRQPPPPRNPVIRVCCDPKLLLEPHHECHLNRSYSSTSGKSPLIFTDFFASAEYLRDRLDGAAGNPCDENRLLELKRCAAPPLRNATVQFFQDGTGVISGFHATTRKVFIKIFNISEYISLSRTILAVLNTSSRCDSVDELGSETELARDVPKFIPVTLITSVPFMLLTILVYATLEDLRNLPGAVLICYLACLSVSYSTLSFTQLMTENMARDIPLCVTLAFIIHFSFLASFFWLNVMCFDIWWTFGGFRSLQGSVKQRERKKFLMYSIYAWGCATTLTVICAIMDYAPSVPDHFIKPGFGSDSCWFKSNAARAIYFYGPMGVTVLCNICLFISTALKIVRHKKDTAHQLKGSESRRHDDNKQWFNLYLKLFIVMGINWSMEIISWLLKDKLDYLWYITDLMNTLQGLIIFIIFVWKDKIKRLLLRRFGCQGRNVLSRNSTRSACNSSSSRTCTTLAPLQEKSNPFADTIQRQKPAYDESDGV